MRTVADKSGGMEAKPQVTGAVSKFGDADKDRETNRLSATCDGNKKRGVYRAADDGADDRARGDMDAEASAGNSQDRIQRKDSVSPCRNPITNENT